jgi:F-type H+-transporting ATPase subunit alpha
MYDNSAFQQLVSANYPTGEVVGVDGSLVTAKGLDGVAIGALVLFETGEHAIVREINADDVLLLNLESEEMKLGSLVVLQNNNLTTSVGEGFIGRVITPLGKPIDGKGPLQVEDTWPVFHPAPSIMERSLLKDQLLTGVTMVDKLFPIVLGQRIAILGDTKSGKSAFGVQLGSNQTGTDRIVVYVLIGKRRVEVDQTINSLRQSGAMANSIVIVANVFDSLAQSYLAPYIGCSIAEYLWYQKNRDCIVIYDDLSSHAKIYRELSLLSQVSPGRESYPGDMFFAHSSLLERAGKLASNGKTLTALPIVLTPGDDITAYLPTSVMSITDGQLIFDLATFRQNIRPAINAGLSVSRVGGRALNSRQKALSVTLFQRLADYRQASEFSHFGSDMSAESKQALDVGTQLNEVFRQSPTELYSTMEQQLMLESVLVNGGVKQLNISELRKKARELASSVKTDADIDTVVQQILQAVMMETKQ